MIAEKSLRTIVKKDYLFTIRLTLEVLESKGKKWLGEVRLG